MKATPLYLFDASATRYIVWRMDGNAGDCMPFYYGIGHATRPPVYCFHQTVKSALCAMGVHRMPQGVQFLYRDPVEFTP